MLAELDSVVPRWSFDFRAVPWLNEIHIVPITSTIRGCLLRSRFSVCPTPRWPTLSGSCSSGRPSSSAGSEGFLSKSSTNLTDAICVVLGCGQSENELLKFGYEHNSRFAWGVDPNNEPVGSEHLGKERRPSFVRVGLVFACARNLLK
jgi:hypothetical protein